MQQRVAEPVVVRQNRVLTVVCGRHAAAAAAVRHLVQQLGPTEQFMCTMGSISERLNGTQHDGQGGFREGGKLLLLVLCLQANNEIVGGDTNPCPACHLRRKTSSSSSRCFSPLENTHPFHAGRSAHRFVTLRPQARGSRVVPKIVCDFACGAEGSGTLHRYR